MPSTALLFPQKHIWTIPGRMYAFLRELVSGVVISKPDLSQHHSPEGAAKQNDDEPELELVKKSTASLFPECNNIDRSLNGGCSVIPCSMDVSDLNTPISMTLSPENRVKCELNGTSLQGSKQEQEIGTSMKMSSSVASSPLSSSSGSTPEHSTKVLSNGEEEFICHYCDATFRIRGYLTRHIKKHAIEKAYHCPFFNSGTPPDLRCHNSGGFSRRDTYKTHLKARHVLYPKGVKPQDRNKSSGHCAQCGEYFSTIENFVENHIESGDCKALPQGYTKKNEKRSGKLRKIKTSNGHSRFISTSQSVVEPKVLFNKDAVEAMTIVANNSSGSDIISKYGNNKLMLNSENFKVDIPKRKRKYTKRKQQQQLSEPTMTTTDKTEQVAPDEISSATIFSPFDTHLEPVPSSSSESSAEVMIPSNQMKNILFDINNFTNQLQQAPDITTFIPLDIEQSSYDLNDDAMSYPVISTQNNHDCSQYSNTKISQILQSQMNPEYLSKSHIIETQQYLDFYNDNFGSQF
ncbi:stp1p [Saccharomyces arboricola H-6]|uniref:Transcription factor STP1 n=1 Tax=Saccharomyces arboricola (strain H-6 / AS 2.3317 / CBS 10644) TaxID=1160507 RepID=J8Q0H9_SACAR|nr:stp1p [Saccharomyces arboricola H-6]